MNFAKNESQNLLGFDVLQREKLQKRKSSFIDLPSFFLQMDQKIKWFTMQSRLNHYGPFSYLLGWGKRWWKPGKIGARGIQEVE